MSMTVVVTRNVSQRVRGFMASAMLEIGPGIYLGARISTAVRERVWSVLQEWLPVEPDAAVIMVWNDRERPCGLAVQTIGSAPIDLVEVDGLILARRLSSAGT